MNTPSKIEKLPIDRLIPYSRNSRTHSDEQVAQIAASLREFGFTNPVLIDEADGIIAGHGRILAARKLGLADIPCIRLSHLSETQKRAYVIADNKLADGSVWNDELLKAEIAALIKEPIDLGSLGLIDILADKHSASIVDIDTNLPPEVSWVLIKCPIEKSDTLQSLLDKLPDGCETYSTAGNEKDR